MSGPEAVIAPQIEQSHLAQIWQERKVDIAAVATSLGALGTFVAVGAAPANAAPEHVAVGNVLQTTTSSNPDFHIKVKERDCREVMGRFVDKGGNVTAYIRLKWLIGDKTHNIVAHTPYNSDTNNSSGKFEFKHIPLSVKPGTYTVSVYDAWSKPGHPQLTKHSQGAAHMKVSKAENC